MELKKGPLGGLVNDAISSMSNSDEQKPTNVKTDSDTLYKDKLMNAKKSGIVVKSDKVSKKFSASNISDSDKFIKWFSDLSNKDVGIAGGKGASLGEMFNNKFPVPPGFVITAQAFDFFMTTSELKEKIFEIIEGVEREDTEKLQQASKQIRKLIEHQKISKELEEEIIEAYHILSSEDIDYKISENALNILKHAQEPIFVSVRSSATTEDSAEASFAGQQESFLNVKGDSNLIEYVKKCFSSLYTPRAIYYRKKKGFKEGESLLAVVVQKMVDSRKSGVVFSRNPINLGDDIIVEAVFGLGEGIVSGRIKPDNYSVLRDLKIKHIKVADKKVAIVRTSSGENEVIKLSPEISNRQVLTNGEILEMADYAIKLEEHYKKPQDIEFAIEDKIYIVQSRPITTGTKGVEKKELSGNVILEGLGSSPGIGVGTVRIIEKMEDLSKIKKGDILVTEMTNPDMVVSMQKSSAIVTDEGGMTAHASIVSREMGIPCVVGTGNATSVLKDGMKITVDGTNGRVYEGEVAEAKTAEIKKAVPTKRVKIKVIVDLPEFAERAAQSGVDFIGLTRIEGIIANSKKHPLLYEKEDNLDEYVELLRDGISRILEHFKGMWIRASDIRTDEYSSLEGAPEREINPMLGLHGIRFSLKHPKIFQAELLAIKQVAEKNPDKKIGIMFPQVINIEEVKKAKEFFNKYKTLNMEFGVMVETPAAVQIIEDICEEVDFISLGTNDLTQYTLAIDRGEEQVQDLYNELNPAIFSQIKRVIGACRRKRVESSICGQAGSNKEMAEFLFRRGISSISVNADAAYEISSLIKQLEEGMESNRIDERKDNDTRVENTRGEYRKEQNREIEISGGREGNFNKKKWKKWKKWEKKAQANILPEINDEFSKEKPDIKGFEEEIGDMEEEETGFLKKEDIKIPAEIEEINEEIGDYKENIGPIEPFNSLERIEDKSEDIKEDVEEYNQEELEERREVEEDIKVEQDAGDSGDSGDSGDDVKDIGVYKPNDSEDREKSRYSYNFDED